jgi:hypothetical protein
VAGGALAQVLAAEVGKGEDELQATVLGWVQNGEIGGGEVRVSYARAMGLLSRAAAGEDGEGELLNKSALVPAAGADSE